MQPSAQFVPAPGAKAAGNTGYAIVNGSLQGSATGKLPLGSNVIDVTAKVIPDRPSVGRAAANFLFKAAWPVQVGIAAYDLIKALGWDATRSETGALIVTRSVDSSTYQATCQGAVYQGTADSLGSTCASVFQSIQRSSGYPSCVLTHYYNAGMTSMGMNMANCSPYASYNVAVQRLTTSTSHQPVTVDDLANKIASESGWPSSSPLPEVIKQALESGETITAPTPTVTGPSTVQGPKSTTTEGGRTVEKQTIYNITYNNNQVSYTTTVTTITNENGQTTTSTETKENEPPPDECAKNPDSLNCADLDVPAGEIPRTSKNIVYTPESWFGGGTCPADKTMTTHGMTIKVWDWQGSCYWLVNYFRPILLIIATIVALMIVLPRGNA